MRKNCINKKKLPIFIPNNNKDTIVKKIKIVKIRVKE